MITYNFVFNWDSNHNLSQVTPANCKKDIKSHSPENLGDVYQINQLEANFCFLCYLKKFFHTPITTYVFISCSVHPFFIPQDQNLHEITVIVITNDYSEGKIQEM